MRREDQQLSNQPAHVDEVPSTSKVLHATNIYHLVWTTQHIDRKSQPESMEAANKPGEHCNLEIKLDRQNREQPT